MEQLPPLGVEITSVIAPTRRIYAPLLQSNADAIQSTPRRSFAYGEHSRQQLDIYEPRHGDDNRSKPILVFFYGGGYFNGDKILDVAPKGLVYANLGHYFAEQGFTTVIPDYRLVAHGAVYPSGAQDLSEAIEWIKTNLAGSTRRNLYIMGNSAGAGHVGAFLLDSSFQKARSAIIGPHAKSLCLKAAAFLGAPVYCDPLSPAVQYLGSDFQRKTTLGLLNRLPKEDDSLRGVNIVVLTAELDPDGMVIQEAKKFVKAWKSKQVGPIYEQHIPFHNHISPPLALGTNIEREEAWAKEFIALLKSFE